MAETLTLVLHGTVTLEDFATAVARFWGVVDTLTREYSTGGVVWEIERLDTGSAILEVRGVGPDIAVRRITQEFGRLAASLQFGRAYDLPMSVRREAADLMAVVGPRIDSLQFSTDEIDAVVTPASQAAAVAQIPLARPPRGPVQAYGAIEGKVQTLSSRNAFKFTLYDSVYDKAVPCFLSPSDEEIMRDAWDRKAMVEGWITRDAETGRPLSVRQIRRVVVLPERERGAWRRARGASPSRTGILPEEAVRVARDAE